MSTAGELLGIPGPSIRGGSPGVMQNAIDVNRYLGYRDVVSRTDRNRYASTNQSPIIRIGDRDGGRLSIFGWRHGIADVHCIGGRARVSSRVVSLDQNGMRSVGISRCVPGE